MLCLELEFKTKIRRCLIFDVKQWRPLFLSCRSSLPLAPTVVLSACTGSKLLFYKELLHFRSAHRAELCPGASWARARREPGFSAYPCVLSWYQSFAASCCVVLQAVPR